MSIKRILAPLLLLALVIGVAACGGGDEDGGTSAQTAEESGTPAAGTEGGPVKIAFSAPGADHGWMAAITENARSEAEKLGDVELLPARA